MMGNDVLIALVTALVALMVACISGLFSYFSNKRTTKVEKQKAYLQYLMHKMNKLEEAQMKYREFDNSKEDSGDMASSIALHLNSHFKKTYDYLSAYSYLFTNTEREYLDLRSKAEQISLSIATYMVRKRFESADLKDEYKGQLLPLETLPGEISNLGNVTRALIQEELKRTFRQFEDLSV